MQLSEVHRETLECMFPRPPGTDMHDYRRLQGGAVATTDNADLTIVLPESLNVVLAPAVRVVATLADSLLQVRFQSAARRGSFLLPTQLGVEEGGGTEQADRHVHWSASILSCSSARLGLL